MRRFFAIIFGALFAANLISGLAVDFILRRVPDSADWRWSFGIFFVLQVAGLAALLGARLLGRQPGAGLGRPLLALFMIWNLLLAVPAALFYLVWAVIAWLIGYSGATASSLEQAAVLAGLAFFPASSLMATVVAAWQLQQFRIRRMTVTIPKLPAGLRGLSIVHLSDLHIGMLTRGKVLEKIVAAANRIDADLVLVTGDLINMSLDDLPGALALLRKIKSRHGLFVCEGNHDLIESRAGFETSVKASGLSFLLNERAAVSINGQRVQLLGLRWGEAMRRAKETTGSVASDALNRLLARRQPDDFPILLAHHPDAFDAAAAAGIPLTLAGHTHGGQLMLTSRMGFGPWLYRYWSGLYRKGSSQMIVSNGAGNWFPLRINAPAELIHIVLEKE